MLVTTVNEVEGYRVVRHLGLVRGHLDRPPIGTLR